MIRDFTTVFFHYDEFLQGLANTLWLAAATLILASLVGCLVAAAMVASRKPLRWLARTTVDSLRCIPFLLLAYLIYYGLPEVGLRFDSWTCGLSALVLYHSAYIAEIVRGAWTHLSQEQLEAGKAFGYSGRRLFGKIILPQLFYASAPLIGNQSVYIIKDTAFLMIITVPELTFAASSVQATYFVPFASFVVAMGLYWIVTLAVESAVRRIEVAAELRRAS